MDADPADAFDWFADWAEGTSPLYAVLSDRIQDDPFLLDVASEARTPSTIPHLLFAAVHARLLDGAATPLREYYPSVVDDPRDPDERVFDLFRSFVADHEDTVRETIRTRRTQTNAVRRTAALYPAFSYVAQHAADGVSDAAESTDEPPSSPLAIVEVGPAAGLNLRWDDYRYDYGDHVVGDPATEVTIESAIRDGSPPLPETPPQVAARLGIDLNPLDVTAPADVTWLRALVWPEHTDRHALLEETIPVARRNPPEIVEGDALERLPELVQQLPRDAARVVYNTQVLYQFTEDDRERFRDVVRDLGRDQPLYWVSGEGAHPDYDEAIELTITLATGGELKELRTVAYQQHGRWVAWPDASR